MALLAGSTIQSWLTFNGTLPVIQPCRFVDASEQYEGDTIEYPITDCSHVCNDSVSLFEPTNNDTLVTCGLWSTLVSSLTYNGMGNLLLPPNDTKSLSLLEPFKAVGLDLDDIPYTLSYADEISDCLIEIYSDVKQFSYSDDGTMPANCSRNDIFPFGTNAGSAGWASTVSSLNTCMNYICNPVTLNPDLAGIGVFSSFVIQSGIAVFALAALIVFELLSPKPEERTNIDEMMRGDQPAIELQTPVQKHKDNLITALVEFHKAQCYFASTIQIAALILFHQNQSDINIYLKSNEPIFDKDLIDSNVLVLLATSAFVPICVVLACITRYGRHSWYVIALSTITVLLATATMGSAYFYFEKDYPYNPNVQDSSFATPSCSINSSSSSGPYLPPLCGHSKLGKNSLPSGDTTSNFWIWVVWANCIIWLTYCIVEKIVSGKGYTPFRARTVVRFRQNRYFVAFRKAFCKYPLWTLVYAVPWSLCLTAQIVLFTAFVEHYFISSTWTLGQIIAVAVWVPSVVEYIYIDFNGIEQAAEYRYPFQYHLKREWVAASVSAANLKAG